MTILYTARKIFGKTREGDSRAWTNHLASGNLTHLQEVVTLDYMLNKNLVIPDYNNDKDWEHIHTIDMEEEVWIAADKCINKINTYETGLYFTQEYVLSRTHAKGKYNLLAISIEPGQECRDININEYTFLGYDLMDQWFENSALTNYDPAIDSFQPSDLNHFALIDNYNKAVEIKQRLRETHPYDGHANTNIIAIWRHNTIGQNA